MTFDVHSTLAYSTVETIVSQTGNTLVLTVQPNQGSLFSTLQQVIIFPYQSQPFLGNAMIARITAIGGDQLTINYSSGNREGTSIRQVQLGDQIANAITPKVFTDIETAISGGGTAQSPLNGNAKALTNNADTDIFTFPLADGEVAGFYFSVVGIAKKDTDWANIILGGHILFYNDGSTLHTQKRADSSEEDSNGGSLDFSPAASGNFFDASLTSNVVTVKFNPQDVGGGVVTPDSINADFTIINPKGKVITFL